jgi:hypothetical protein
MSSSTEEPWVELANQMEALRGEIAAIRARVDEITDSSSSWEREQLEQTVERGGLEPDDQQNLRTQLGVNPREPSAVAVVDWTALRNCCFLLEGIDPSDFERFRLDPFTALADLASVIGAVLFYDRVFVIAEDDMVWRANRLLGLGDQPIASLSANLEGATTYWFDRCFSAAMKSLDDADREQAEWLGWLTDAWKRLLPDVDFPSHTRQSYQSQLSYSDEEYYGSDEDYHGSGAAAPYREMSIFRHAGDSWRLRDTAISRVILDNDVRALFYEYLTSSMSQALSDGQSGPTVSYIGGCLRSPMMLARARYAEASLSDNTVIEHWLQSQWRDLYRPTSAQVQMPFWMNAVLASAHNRADIASAVREARNAARPLRKTRSRLDEALRLGDSKTINELMNILKGDLSKATEPLGKAADLGAGVARAVSQSVLPVAPADLVASAVKASVDSSILKRLALRLFRPHLRFVLSMTSKASEREKVVVLAARIFEWPKSFSAEPLAFLERLSDVAWIA